MGKNLALTCLALAMSLTACAGTQSMDAPDRIQVTGLDVANDPKVDMRYPVLLTYDAKGDVKVIDSCFLWFDKAADFTSFRSTTWLGEGPYCFSREEDVGPDTVKSMLVSGYPGTYQLEGYVRYYAAGVSRETNHVSTEIIVSRRY
jgi:hypothetical protein